MNTHAPTHAFAAALLAAAALAPAWAQMRPPEPVDPQEQARAQAQRLAQQRALEQAQQQAQGSAAAAPQDSVRPALVAPINAGLDLLAAGKFQEALAKVAEAEAVPDRTPYENFLLDQLRGGAAAGAGDLPTAVRSYEAALATGRLQGAQALRIVEGLVGASYRLKDDARTLRWGRRYLADGGSNPQVRALLVNAAYRQGDWAGAVTLLQPLVGDDEAAGQTPPEDRLRLLASAQNKQGDQAGYAQTLERLLRYHPKPAYWRDRVARLQAGTGFDPALLIDSYRLLEAAGALQTAADDTSLAELALHAGLPAEAQAVLDAGFAAGRLGSGAEAAAQQALRERATRAAAADLKTLDAVPPPSAAGDARVAQGLALATSGRTDRGLAMIEQGLAEGSVGRPDLARLRLAWVNARAGRAAAAQAVLSGLQGAPGGLGDLARLWLILLQRPAKA